MKKLSLFLFLTILAISSCTSDKSGKGGNINDNELFENFQNPPQEARMQVWWHWMDGNITKDGIRKDLEWMHRVGIGGFHQFDAGIRMEPIVEHRLIYMHDDWKDAFRYATQLADSLGLDMTIASSPGWSATGGPWVKPENAMKKVVWRQIRITGGQKEAIKLPEPYHSIGTFQNARASRDFFGEPASENQEAYGDIAVVAIKIPDADKTLNELGAKVSSSDPGFSVDNLTDGDLTTGSTIHPNSSGYAWIQYEFPENTEFRSASIVDGRSRGQWANTPADTSTILECSNDGRIFREIARIPSTGASQQTIAFSPVSAKYFRVRIVVPKPGTDNSTSIMGYRINRPTSVFVPEFNLYAVERINHAEEKAGFANPHDLHEYMTQNYGGSFPTEVINLTDKVKDGVLEWDVPEGRWKIYRFGWSLTGKKNGPAPAEATGLEVDKLDPQAWAEYFRTYFDMYKEASGGLIGAKGIRNILTDSYEAGIQNWTPAMIEEFKARRGYDMLEWIPVLSGEIISSPEESEKFLWDWRMTIGELYAENYANIDKIAAEYGINGRFTEAHENGRVYCVDGMDVKKKADVPMSAIWMPNPGNGGSTIPMAKADMRESSSTAHIFGGNLAAAESLTVPGSNSLAYSYSPENLKPIVDLEFANGINKIVIHESAHQPDDEHVPGTGLMNVGQWFNRHETWAEYARPWVDYVSRSSYLLQQGHYVADILYYYGEDSNITAQYGFSLPDVPDGYAFDFINPSALTELLKVKDGKFATDSGMKYNVLVLDRNCEAMSLKVLRKLAEFSREGGRIVGQAPVSIAGSEGGMDEFNSLIAEIWGSDKTFDNIDNALADVPKDYITDSEVNVVHRDLGGEQVWWVSNVKPEYKTITVSFNIYGFKPQIWNPVDGSISDASYEMSDGRTTVTIPMTPNDALFIVFSEKTKTKSLAVPKIVSVEENEVDGPWNVSFEGIEAPEPAIFETLSSFSENSNPAIKYFSGTATYSKKINAKTGGKVILSLGSVKNLAEVIVNGKTMGIVWKEPFSLDIASALKDGENELTIKVANLWVNRLIGDEQPGAKKYTYTPVKFYSADDKLLPSGLLGPVTISYEQDSE